jgi:D-alanyl-lipoteichoic acid acyltransferase DltB (MBOAT superfamily)
MLFNSFIFIFFLSVLLPSHYLLRSRKSRNILLLLASYFFYGYWDWRFCSLLVISSVVDFLVGRSLYATGNKSRRKLLLLISLTANLGILGFFKYFNFFVDSFVSMISIFHQDLDFLHLNIILPVGISFYTFQTLSYTIDIYRGRLTPTNSFLDFALFVSFFPQLVAGPIERAANLLPQISAPRKTTRQQFQDGAILIVYGLFKKVLIGDAAGRYVDHIFAQMDLYSSWEVVFALFMFSIQIYADFSGYSNIARGTAKLFGFEIMKNFEQPYFSTNITEFWRRWHISLSSWLKDYLYISLGGNRRGINRTYLNLMITMILGGLWHGASWNFVIWGILHGIYLAVHKFMTRGKKIVSTNKPLQSPRDIIRFLPSNIITYLLVVLTWLFFRAQGMDDIRMFVAKCTEWTWGNYPMRFMTILLGFTVITAFFDYLEYKTGSHVYFKRIPSRSMMYGMLTVMMLSVLMFLINSRPLPFIYFQF